MPTVIDSFYLVTLGSYRFFYILNWILRGVLHDRLEPIFPISVICGVVQTALYFDFAWVYWGRQRVKLRGGGVVDSEDFSKSWLVSKIIGRRSTDDVVGDEAERQGLARQEEGHVRPEPQHTNSWGPRGISVSADDDDDGVDEAKYARGNGHATKAAPFQDGMTDPAAFKDDVEDEVEEEPSTVSAAAKSGVSNGEEWRDEGAK